MSVADLAVVLLPASGYDGVAVPVAAGLLYPVTGALLSLQSATSAAR